MGKNGKGQVKENEERTHGNNGVGTDCESGDEREKRNGTTAIA